MPKTKYVYAVYIGRNSSDRGVYRSYYSPKSAFSKVNKVSGARHHKFSSVREARAWIAEGAPVSWNWDEPAKERFAQSYVEANDLFTSFNDNSDTDLSSDESLSSGEEQEQKVHDSHDSQFDKFV